MAIVECTEKRAPTKVIKKNKIKRGNIDPPPSRPETATIFESANESEELAVPDQSPPLKPSTRKGKIRSASTIYNTTQLQTSPSLRQCYREVVKEMTKVFFVLPPNIFYQNFVSIIFS